MKELTLFYLEHCPYCLRARQYMAELRAENPKYAQIPVKMVEEWQQRSLASQYDYYYVPCFYIGDEKISEGSIDKAGVQQVLDTALED